VPAQFERQSHSNSSKSSNTPEAHKYESLSHISLPGLQQDRKASLLPGLQVIFYCSKEHQASDRPTHKKACNAVKKAQQNLDIEEQKLRDHPGDFMTPDNLFEHCVSHF
tara:strand:+ start:3164 stop:3490 length:327 start_codon:yes stop_codon:yes gene_type:complete